MTRLKCAYSCCRKVRSVNPKFSVFTFPLNDEERSKQWITNSGNSLDASLANYRFKGICEDHFSKESFVNETKRRLIHTAVPIHYISDGTPEGNFEKPIISIRDDLFSRKNDYLHLFEIKSMKERFQWLDKILESNGDENNVNDSHECQGGGRLKKRVGNHEPAKSYSREKIVGEGTVKSYPRKFINEDISIKVEDQVKIQDQKIIDTLYNTQEVIKKIRSHKRKMRRKKRNLILNSETDKFIFYMRKSHFTICKLKNELMKCKRELKKLRRKNVSELHQC